VNAEPIIRKVLAALDSAGLEAILIGNAAAALCGAPVTTLDFDFFVRDLEGAADKLQRVADELEAVLLPPAFPTSRAYKIENEAEDIFLDFIDNPAGMGSFASVRSRAEQLAFPDSRVRVYVASLADVIASKKALGRPKDLALLPILEATLDEKVRLDRQTPAE